SYDPKDEWSNYSLEQVQFTEWYKQSSGRVEVTDSPIDYMLGAGIGKALLNGGRKLAVRAAVKAGSRKATTSVIRNNIPNRLARVIPANINSKTLGAPNAIDVFVTASDDIAGMSSKQIARRLTIPNSETGFRVIEFNTPRFGISSPINRLDPGFVGYGRTLGGAREFTIPNQLIPNDAIINIIP
ncbi:polymorphic toxin type 10 domain-containing protein, partial [Marinifilum sp. RC60d5]|uniref:polymorphic toxin type 10 domain-containing protein n=1 Tax=Marinifilum sp. RC60d5 TaxID=3458414 RepID=UPI0040351180